MSTWEKEKSQSQSGGWGAGAGKNHFRGFDQIDPQMTRNPYIPGDCSGRLAVEECRVVESTQRAKGAFFLVSFTATEPLVGYKIEGEERVVSRVEQGDPVDWLAKLDNESYLRSIKALMLALNPDASPRDFTEETMNAIVSEEQPLTGVTVKFRSSMIKTSKGSDFTKIYWITDDE